MNGVPRHDDDLMHASSSISATAMIYFRLFYQRKTHVMKHFQSRAINANNVMFTHYQPFKSILSISNSSVAIRMICIGLPG
eukprot:scaffold86573_cov36-Cyclotella_meneghiniana.AAC.2